MEGIEQWRELPSNNKYLISDHGNLIIKNFRRSGKNRNGSIRTIDTARWVGYKSTMINGKCKLMHRLVAEAFIPNPKNYKYVNHLDSDRGNNQVSNLEWCTQSHNCKHSYSSGTNPIEKKLGSNNGRAKFDDLQVKVIKSLKGELSQVAIAGYFKRPQSIIGNIHRGKNWAHI